MGCRKAAFLYKVYVSGGNRWRKGQDQKAMRYKSWHELWKKRRCCQGLSDTGRRTDYGLCMEFQPELGWRIYVIFPPCCQDHDERTRYPIELST